MSGLFAELQKAKEKQQEELHNTPPLPEKAVSKRDEQNVAQKSTQTSKTLSKPVSNNLSKQLTTEAVEELAFQLRKVTQAKVNANVPLLWKDKLDDLAFRLKVGKYELLTYIIGVYLGEVERSDS